MKQIYSTVIALLLLVAGTPSVNAETPEQFTYAGYLTEDGEPLNSSIDVDIEIYDAESDGVKVWSDGRSDVDVTDGEFALVLDGTDDLASLFDGDDYWLLVIIDDLPMEPMTPISSVPFAVRASDADTVGGMTADDLLAGGSAPAADVGYDNTTSELEAEDVQSAIDELVAEVATLRASVDGVPNLSDLEDAVAQNTGDIEALGSRIGDLDTATDGQGTRIGDLETDIDGHNSRIGDLETKTASMSAVGTEVVFSGVNVNVVDGSGNTVGDVNGLGNLVVGYNEGPVAFDADRSGSHNLVVGMRNNYSSYGGLVVGVNNQIQAPYASVSGGRDNVASGSFSRVSGGSFNTASGDASSVGSGYNNTASAWAASVSGGRDNTASESAASVSGGYLNVASFTNASVSGGRNNTASGENASVSGGRHNTAAGSGSWVSGGNTKTATAADSIVLGALAIADSSAVFAGVNVSIVDGSGDTEGDVNGLGNLIVGYNEVPTDFDEARGGSHNLVVGAQNNYSSYGGLVAGSHNQVLARFSSVSGGQNNVASAGYTSVGGGYENTASNGFSSVSGGAYNTASGLRSAVSGGQYNTASNWYSSVSGGRHNTAAGNYSWVAGGDGGTASEDDSAVLGSLAIAGTNAVFTGTNVHIVDGSGDTDGDVNGRGNLIVGYNEVPTSFDEDRGGSHNLILGMRNNYSSHSGLVVGSSNQVLAPFASVSGGADNIASGVGASVSGGDDNTASGLVASVSGGVGNTASGAMFSSVSGGAYNTASGPNSSVGGGAGNTASGDSASVGGGVDNSASGAGAMVSGGKDRAAEDLYDWRAGTLFEDE